MFFCLVMFVWPFVVDLAAVSWMADGEKDLEILLLRQQLWIVERKQRRGSILPCWQKVLLAVVALLFAPSSGKKTRTDLAKIVEEGLHSGRDAVEPLVKRMEEEIGDLCKKVEERVMILMNAGLIKPKRIIAWNYCKRLCRYLSAP